jgi:hypothetical protein
VRRSGEAESAVVLQLTITLRGTNPPIWRHVLVSGTLPLDKLHSVIQAAMGWSDAHEHAFKIRDEEYGIADSGDDEEVRDEFGVPLREVLNVGDHFSYEYDFGDDWVHDIGVESLETTLSPLLVSVCLAGARSCPPEDVGGVSRYAKFVQAMSDPHHEGHAEAKGWFGRVFDAENFSLSAANAAIQRIH